MSTDECCKTLNRSREIVKNVTAWTNKQTGKGQTHIEWKMEYTIHYDCTWNRVNTHPKHYENDERTLNRFSNEFHLLNEKLII